MQSQRITSYDQSQLKNKDHRAGFQKLVEMKDPPIAMLMPRKMHFRMWVTEIMFSVESNKITETG